jgi:translation initiation factor 5A
MELLPANQVRVGTYIMINDVVCKVLEYHTAKTGKHGSAKMLVKAQELINGKQKEGTFSTSDMLDVPVITRKEFQLSEIDEDDYLHLIDESNNLVEDIKLTNSDASNALRDAYENRSDDKDIMVQILFFLNTHLIVDHKMVKIK